MAEEHKIGFFVDTNPVDVLFIKIKRCQLLRGRTIFLILTAHAFGGFGQSHRVTTVGIQMTIFVNETQRKMLSMSIGNQLLRSLCSSADVVAVGNNTIPIPIEPLLRALLIGLPIHPTGPDRLGERFGHNQLSSENLQGSTGNGRQRRPII